MCRLRDVYRSIAAFEDDFEKRYHINITEAMLLCSLQEKGQLSAKDITEELGLKKSNASKLIASLEDRKLLLRHLGKKDRRQMIFSLSKLGMETLAGLDCNEIELPPILNEIV